MNISLDKRDMTHICHLLQDDLICTQQMLDEDPLDDEAAASMLRSKRVLLKINAGVLLQSYEPKSMESRRRLN
jgi:hypothetical protein